MEIFYVFFVTTIFLGPLSTYFLTSGAKGRILWRRSSLAAAEI